MGTSERSDLSAVVTVLVGAVCIASSAVLVRLAGSSAGATAILRCAFALPVLGGLAWIECRRRPAGLTTAGLRLIRLAGLFLGVDLIVWTHCIAAVGAGLATVLGNLQVLVVGLLAWRLLGERLERALLVALPIMAAGVVLLGGVIGHGAYGAHPMRGVLYGVLASTAYAIFLLLYRRGMTVTDGRPVRGGLARSLFEATAGALVASVVMAVALRDFRIGALWPALGWLALLAITAQVLGWLLISDSLPRLPAALTSTLLLVQPVAAVVMAAVIFGERPSAAQLAGVGLILLGVVVAASGRARRGVRRRIAARAPAMVNAS